MRQIIFVIAMLGGLTVIPAMGHDTTSGLQELAQGLPENIENWRRSPDFSVYDSDNLYTYINGGAELYISYQFSTMISLSYGNEDDEEITIDIFAMGSPQKAYGVFSHSREAIDDFVGPAVESEYAGGLLTFWKGQYYVSMLAYPETEAKKLVVQALARNIADRIQGTSSRPRLVSRLPEEGRQPYSSRYFSHHTWLNTYHFFSHENVLNIDSETEVAMATYAVGGSRPAVLILLNYPGQAAAAAAHQTFTRTFTTDAQAEYSSGVDGLFTGCVRNGSLLVIVVDAPDMETAERLVQGVEQP